jgi:ABC-type sugar transport system substrate-binding protein
MEVYMKRIFMTLAVSFLILFLGGMILAEGQVETEPEKTTIGMVYRTVTPTYFYKGVQYQCFYIQERPIWSELAAEEDFNFLEIQGGSIASTSLTAIDQLINRGTDGIIFCFSDPSGVAVGIEDAWQSNIPILSSGIRPAKNATTPFVGWNGRKIGRDTGRATGRYFKDTYPNKAAKVLITNTRTVNFNIEKEEGFIAGLKEVLPNAEITAQLEDNGVIQDVTRLVTASLSDDPEVNILVGTNDLRAQGILQAITGLNFDTEAVVVGFGGTENAMRNITNPENPWKIEAGYKLREHVETSYEVMTRMVSGEIDMKSSEEFLTDAQILVEPSREEAEKYLQINHNIDEMNW